MWEFTRKAVTSVQSREEGVALAVQLAECKERTRQAEDSADDAHNETQGLRERLEEAQAELQHMQQKVVDTAANCRRYTLHSTPLAVNPQFTIPSCLVYGPYLPSMQRRLRLQKVVDTAAGLPTSCPSTLNACILVVKEEV